MKINRGQLLTNKKAASIKSYQRFKDTPSGVSPRAIPGQKSIFTSSSDEHNPYGHIYEGEKNKIKIENKRFRKLDAAIKEIPKPKIYGPKNADITILSWGSPKGAILEAIEDLNKQNIKVNFMQFLYIYPFHSNYVEKFLKKCKTLVCIEENKTGQLANIITEFTGVKIKQRILKYGGRAFFPSEIEQEIKRLYYG